MPKPRDEALPTAVRVARISARLAHRLADREAILAGHELSDAEWCALEAEVVIAIHQDSRVATEFASAYGEARRELLGVAIQAAPQGRKKATTDLMRTLAKPR